MDGIITIDTIMGVHQIPLESLTIIHSVEPVRLEHQVYLFRGWMQVIIPYLFAMPMVVLTLLLMFTLGIQLTMRLQPLLIKQFTQVNRCVYMGL